MKKSAIIAIVGIIGYGQLNGSPYPNQIVAIYDGARSYTLNIKAFNEKGYGFPASTISRSSDSQLWLEDNASCTRYVIESKFGRVCLGADKNGWFYYRLKNTTIPLDELTFSHIQFRNNPGTTFRVKMAEDVTKDMSGIVYFIVDVGITTKNNIKIKMKRTLPGGVILDLGSPNDYDEE